jgi:hypothetical protein
MGISVECRTKRTQVCLRLGEKCRHLFTVRVLTGWLLLRRSVSCEVRAEEFQVRYETPMPGGTGGGGTGD